ncbi:MAG: YncE family protein [Chitinophagaceae bacterium]
MKKTLLAVLLIALQQSAVYAQPSTEFKVVKTFHIASNGGWDYLAVGPANKLYVSHGSQVNVLNKTTGDSIGVIVNTTGVHGIAFDPKGMGFTSNGRLNNVTVFDPKTDQETGHIATGENPDAIMYDPFSKMIVTCNGRSKDLTVIDPSTQKVVTTIPVGGKPETAVSDENGNWFVNIEDKNEIVKVNSKTYQVEAHWMLTPAEGPTGLAIDKAGKRLFVGCDKQLAILNYTTGKIVTTLPIGDGCDGVAFNNKTKTIFTSNGEGTMTIIKEITADSYKVLQTLATKRSARTIAIDESTETIYLPAVDYESQPVTAGGRPKSVPGSFQILMIK